MPNESIRLQTSDGNIFAFSYDEIQTLGREVGDRRNVQRENRTFFNRPSGYMGEVIVGGGFTTNGGYSASLSVVNGFRVVPQFAVGLGIGFETIETGQYWVFLPPGPTAEHVISPGRNVNFFPIYLHLRSDFLDRAVSPFAVVNIGYAMGNYHRPFTEVILGCSFNIGQRNRMSIGLNGRTLGGLVSSGLSIGFSW